MFNILHKDDRQQSVGGIVANDSFQISNPKQINLLLSHAHETHALFLAYFAGHSEQFTTALLGVYPKHGFLVLDELSPKQGHELLLDRKECKVTGKLDGVDLRFTTQLIEAKSKSGIAFYKAAIPKTVFYRQRREDFRVSTGAKNIPFHGYRGQGYQQVLRGSVIDISRNGMGIVLDDTVNMYPGDMIPACTVTLPNKEKVLFSLEARSVHPNRNRGTCRIGGRFAEIDKPSRRKIVRLLKKLERQQCKRLRGS
jgi:c-di-GMP-binding flagellar brake protein YcgR